MTETWLHDHIGAADYGTPPPAFDLTSVTAAGNRAHGRRRVRRSVAAGVAVALVGGAAYAVPSITSRRHVGSLSTAGRGTAADAVIPPYWGFTFSQTIDITDNGVKINNDAPEHSIIWEGNNRPSWGAPGATPSKQSQQPAYSPSIQGHTLTWDQLWAIPATKAGLEQYLRSLNGTDPTPQGLPERLSDLAVAVAQDPGPIAVKLAAMQLLADQPGTTATTGTDPAGRPARIFSFVAGQEPGGQQTETAWLDPTTGYVIAQREVMTQTDKAGTSVNTETWTWDHIGPTEGHAAADVD